MGQVLLDQIKHHFPRTGVSLMFGYGSKVIKQNRANSSDDLLDIIIAVDDSTQWHRENIEINKHHYSLSFPATAKRVAWLQEEFGARVYFNPYINVGNLSIKYGVIKTDHLVRDLTHWDKLYIAGRLHKPVEFLINTCEKNEVMKEALRFNKESALRAALLQLPEKFDQSSLYRTITALSYHGDIRMLFGEDRNKINNIVEAQSERFDQLYLPIIKMSPNFKDVVHWSESCRKFSQDHSPKTLLRHLKLLPQTLRRSVCEIHRLESRAHESDIVLSSLSKNINCDRIVAQALMSIVRRSSTAQTIKGLITAGIFKSIRYGQRKIIKSLTSRFSWT